MIYLLDTNIVSYWMRGDEEIIGKIRRRKPSELSLSTITLAEIYYGIEKSPIKKKERRIKIERIHSQLEVYPFEETAAQKYAVIRTRLEKQGAVISERDLQIASIAMANKLIVVTHNVKEFSRIVHLKWEDWADSPGR
ncbi:MAG: type II toxin-antitoxin system VapC family toxin [Deltaproteobacteria bacterium]|nr:type II toxin-antitoxin system VapC family toxin [Deltaproteobacteria bacterium]MBW1817855.1 type II toxin-antitoxin system VapC family toxin [Deltaproteobacteria bacterium]